MTRRKTSFSISSPSSKLTISHILYTVLILGYKTIINRSSKWFVSTCGLKANSPLTTRISDIFSSPVRQPSCGNFHVILLRYHASMQPCLHSTDISKFKTFTPWRSNHWRHLVKNSSSILVCKILNAWASEFLYVWRGSMWTKRLNARISHGRKFVRRPVNVA